MRRLMAGLLAVCTLTSVGAEAKSILIYRFLPPGPKGKEADGYAPLAGLTPNPDTTLSIIFGTASSGGMNGCGTVFQLSLDPSASKPTWIEKRLHSFNCTSDGATPANTLTAGSVPAGGSSYPVLYGTTTAGGTNASGSGSGVVFELVPSTSTPITWSLTPLYTFSGGTSDGATPTGPLYLDSAGILGPKGSLYGTTGAGGAYGGGVAFQLSPPTGGGTSWGETILASFGKGRSQGSPTSGLVIGPSSALYGTESGGTGQNGDVFALHAPSAKHHSWTYQIVYSFLGNTDGATPSGPLLYKEAVLYGTTEAGGCTADGCNGSVYQLAPPVVTGGKQWTETVLHTFVGPAQGGGGTPYGGVSADTLGDLYGTTSVGGALPGGAPGKGIAYELQKPASGSTTWNGSLLHVFSGVSSGQGSVPDGANPTTAPVFVQGFGPFGLTPLGGKAGPNGTYVNGGGTAYKLTH